MLRLTRTRQDDADWCNGSTTDSDSVCEGSSPSSVVENLREQILNFLFKRSSSFIHIGVWLSLVERYVRDVEVACSNHVTPIGYKAGKHKRLQISAVSFFLMKIAIISSHYF